MIYYVEGLVLEIYSDFIVVENNKIGYQIFCGKTDTFTIGDVAKVFTYMHVREDAMTLFGFSNQKEKDLFTKLIEVKGIGPKTAINIFSKGNIDDLIVAIDSGDIKYLTTLPKIGPKTAKQIILDLANKLKVEQKVVVNQDLEDALEGLKGLGYSVSEVNVIKSKLSRKVMSVNEYIKEGLSIINKTRSK